MGFAVAKIKPGGNNGRIEKKQFLEWTRRFWQARTQKTLSDEDARQIIENVTGFFKVLNKCQEKENERASSSSK